MSKVIKVEFNIIGWSDKNRVVSIIGDNMGDEYYRVDKIGGVLRVRFVVEEGLELRVVDGVNEDLLEVGLGEVLELKDNSYRIKMKGGE